MSGPLLTHEPVCASVNEEGHTEATCSVSLLKWNRLFVKKFRLEKLALLVRITCTVRRKFFDGRRHASAE